MRKNLLLTCLLTLVAAFGIAQTTQWPITLTKADGLPGVKQPIGHYSFTSEVYNLDNAVSTLRMTVCETTATDSSKTAYGGYSQGWGPGNPIFALGEVKILDAAGNQIDYIASSNAVSTWDGGGINALNDSKIGTFFRSTWYKGACPQDYHYIEFELTKPISEFQIQWHTTTQRINTEAHKGFSNDPTYVGLTPGTPYYPYPEQNFQLGEKVTDVATLAEGGLYVIRDNAPEYWYNYNNGEDSYDRGEATKNKAFYHSPCGGNVTANAASVVYFIPTGEENTYKMRWLNTGQFAAKQSSAAWVPWTNMEDDAAAITFTPSETSEGNFNLTINGGSLIYLCDALGKMACTNNVDTILAKRSRPFDKNFSIYKASVNVAKIKSVVEATVADAKEYIALYGFNEVEDKGEKAALESAISAAEALLATDASVADLLAADNSVKNLLPAYVALAIYQYTDSIQTIVEAIDNEEIILSSSTNWVEGSYPEGSDATLRAASEAAFLAVESYTCVADINKAISEVMKAISAFWASKITGVMQLPFRVGTADGTPGALQSYGGYKWESPLYNLTGETETIRFTYFKTNNNAVYSGTQYVFPTFGEIEFYDASGNKIALTAESFTSNAIMTRPYNATGDYQGYGALVDGNTGTYAHATWCSGQVPDYDANPTYMWLEVTFPEAISSFKYVQYGRSNGVNTPVDFVFGYAGVDATPETVPFPDPYNAVCGEKITDVSQITDDGIYAIQGLISCDPVNHFDIGQQNPHFYSATTVYGEILQAPCAFSITKTGDADGSFYIQSLSNCKYWSAAIDEDGWGDATDTYYKEAAAKVLITPNNNDGLPNSFVLYQYVDTVKRNGEPHPYVVFQDWGSTLATFSIPSLEDNDKDGEGEWYIFKMTMDNAYVYWLQNLITAAEALGLEKRPDPGYYADLGSFPEALAASQKAVAEGNNATAKELVAGLSAAIAEVQGAKANPMVAGTYVIESGHPEFIAKTGKYKALFAYDNDGDENIAESAYKLWWGDAPEGDYNKASDYYKFEFISATASEEVAVMLEDGIIDSIQAANAYYIKSVAYNQYIGTQYELSQPIGLTETPETFYIVRQQSGAIFDIWNPAGKNFSLHAAGHSGGSGTNGNIVYWSGLDQPSWWRLRKATDAPVVDKNELAINDLTTAPGRSITLPVEMTNSEAVTAFQIDLELPEGVEFVSAVLNNSRKTASHTISTSMLANGKRRIIAYSNENKAFKYTTGTLLNINVNIPENTENGDYAVKVSNIRLVKPDSKEILLDPVTANITVKEVKGDANNDFDVTIGDVVAVANYILELFTGSFNIEAADVNGDGEISMGDLVAIVNIILNPDSYDYNGKMAKRGVMAESGSAISMPDTRSTEGTATVPVSLNNTTVYTAFQMDVELPEGATLASATLCDRAAGHNIAWSKLPDGKMRVVAYSTGNEAISGNAGELIALNIKAEKAVSGAINVDNVRMVTPAGTEYVIGNCGSLLDINGTTGIGTTEADKIVSVRYFNEAGVELKEPVKGVNIIITEYADGKIESKKMIVKK